nr:MAG TPA: zinc finger domain protein [Caudoviricetes sp.]
MIRVNAYRCSYCGKLFLTERGCVKHEEKYCNKLPCNIAACYSCKWYKETGQTTTITRTGFASLAGHEYEYEKTVCVNICLKHHNAKMFNSFHASAELVDDAENSGFRIMPTMEEGCLNYKKKENED